MKNEKKLILNPFLYQELSKLADPVQCFCFSSMEHGIRDFARQSGIAAKSLPTGKEAEEIEKEWAVASTDVSVATSSGDIMSRMLKALPGAYTINFAAGTFNTPREVLSDEEQPPKEAT